MSFDFSKLKGKKVNPLEKEAKGNVLKSISDEAGKRMSDKLAGLKKVTIASDSKGGLKEGLDKAKEIVEGKSPELSDAMDAASESGDDAEESSETESEKAAELKNPEMEEFEDKSPEELDALISELEALKASKLHKA